MYEGHTLQMFVLIWLFLDWSRDYHAIADQNQGQIITAVKHLNC